MFILSEGLTNTGVANAIGRQVLRLAGNTEARMIFVIMLSSGVLSAFMNNIGVAALMLPVVVDIARKVGIPASRLLMPLAYGSLLGGLTTLIGTPPNLLVANALKENGLRPFWLFDFTPVGGLVMLVGIAYVALVGRHVLPRRDSTGDVARQRGGKSLREEYNLGEMTFILSVNPESPVNGLTLEESRLGRALGLSVVAL